jgi:hypothetical protein
MHAFLTSARDEVAFSFTFFSLRFQRTIKGACSTGASLDRRIGLDAMAKEALSAHCLESNVYGPPRCPAPVPTELGRLIDIMRLPGEFNFG